MLGCFVHCLVVVVVVCVVVVPACPPACLPVALPACPPASLACLHLPACLPFACTYLPACTAAVAAHPCPLHCRPLCIPRYQPHNVAMLTHVVHPVVALSPLALLPAKPFSLCSFCLCRPLSSALPLLCCVHLSGVLRFQPPMVHVYPPVCPCMCVFCVCLVHKTSHHNTQVMADLVQECGKYGTVLGLKVPRPPPGTAAQLINTGHFGKVRETQRATWSALYQGLTSNSARQQLDVFRADRAGCLSQRASNTTNTVCV